VLVTSHYSWHESGSMPVQGLQPLFRSAVWLPFCWPANMCLVLTAAVTQRCVYHRPGNVAGYICLCQ